MSELPPCCAGRCPCHSMALAWQGDVDCPYCKEKPDDRQDEA